MRAHIIENNMIVNTVEVDNLEFMPGLVDASIGGSIGDSYVNGNIIQAVMDNSKQIRERRGECLSELDTVTSNPLRWAEFTDDEKVAISSYRQELLDITKQTSFPDYVIWPVKPVFIG